MNQLAAGKCPLTDVTELPDKGPDRICGRIDLSPSPAPSTQNFRLPLAADSVFNGGLQTLDGVHWKNSIFRNVRIEYGGGPIEL